MIKIRKLINNHNYLIQPNCIDMKEYLFQNINGMKEY